MLEAMLLRAGCGPNSMTLSAAKTNIMTAIFSMTLYNVALDHGELEILEEFRTSEKDFSAS